MLLFNNFCSQELLELGIIPKEDCVLQMVCTFLYCVYKLYVNACVASGGWVPMGQGAATAIHPKVEEHPQAYQPATQPRAPPRPAPHYSTRHTEAGSPVEVK